MEIISVVPRGYCQGVVRAIMLAKETVKKYPDQKVTMLGMIVHNQYVVDACRKAGIQFIEDPLKTREQLLDEIDEGVVIFTAHGISDAVRDKAEKKGLICVDATCPDVKKTHTLVKEHVRNGDVIYIGKKHHPEAEGTVSLSPRIHLVTSCEDVASLPDLHNVLITNQTTLSLLDAQKIIAACKKRFPDAVVAEEICNATRIRQEAVMALKDVDLLIVVGDPRSNNSRMLAETGKKAGIGDALLLSSAQELKESMIQNKKRIAVTSGSSTPNALTKQVIDCLKAYADTGILPHVSPDPEVL
ncbi:MAG: 4-hydroxy-3-methylbut-2-enyl diphosphate reductase [Lactimicrobium sp.]|jgi:4-hydroxy-3-methylbut-2-enyl diphosphate reductase|uniref:4-hydroxy-3-methylbut-2-enyl diphosphate reductase n=1 Tax=Lactimicrobium sp. TaxID=2563780 RepID=UPI002F353681